MCGIAGILGKTNKGEHLIHEMVDAITHRGPDEFGYYTDKDFSMGMRRLSIIDLGGGHQPIENEDGNLTIVFNGEIYNYRELRKTLKQKGHQFTTQSDTEVVLHLYEEYGSKMLTLLRGMFTFAIYNKTTKEVFIARDYFGIKPLYYLVDRNNVVAFASEIKSLLLHPAARKEVNEEAIFQYLSYQYNPLQETFFKNIWKLPPGHFLRVNIAELKVCEQQYWGYQFHQENISEKVLAKQLLEHLRESVRAHMIADVPVGAFLSGGIDSAVIVSLMARETEQKINTFTVTFDSVSEANEARVIAKALKTNHQEINVTRADFMNALPNMVWHFDEPVADPSAVGLYFLAKEARKKVKVVLSGEGSDELFGGYNIYREPLALSVSNFIPKFLRKLIIKPLVTSSLNFYGKNYLKRFLTPVEERYIGNARVFQPDEVKKLWRGRNYIQEAGSFEKTLPSMQAYKQAERNGAHSDSAKMQYIDINYWMPGDILQKADKMTMAHSLELRVPFLDIDIARISSRIPDSLKYKNGMTKYILRRAVRGIIPKESSNRKKLGFPTALKLWLREDPVMLKTIRDTISSNRHLKKYIDLASVMGMIEEHSKTNADHSRKIYLLYILSLWFNKFLDK